MPSSAPFVVSSKPARAVLALLRIAVGFVFLWSFLDKTFGLHYSTGPARAWINGGDARAELPDGCHDRQAFGFLL